MTISMLDSLFFFAFFFFLSFLLSKNIVCEFYLDSRSIFGFFRPTPEIFLLCEICVTLCKLELEYRRNYELHSKGSKAKKNSRFPNLIFVFQAPARDFGHGIIQQVVEQHHLCYYYYLCEVLFLSPQRCLRRCFSGLL